MIKALKVWWLYWRYRNITQRRQRIQLWMSKRKRPAARVPYRPRGSAMPTTYYRSRSRQVWLPILAMVILLTLLDTYGGKSNLNGTVLHALGALIIVAGIYGAMTYV